MDHLVLVTDYHSLEDVQQVCGLYDSDFGRGTGFTVKHIKISTVGQLADLCNSTCKESHTKKQAKCT